MMGEIMGGDIVEPAAFDFYSALLFIDISGFTPLCAMHDVDAVQAHINRYFTQLIEVILECGGDVIRFAGDAIYCSWSLPTSCSESSKAHVNRAAAHCGLKLVREGRYYIKQLDVSLAIRAGVGAGVITGMRVGTSERWEFILTGEPMKQVADAEGFASPGQICVSPDVWAIVSGDFESKPRKHGFVELLENRMAFNLLEDSEMHTELLGRRPASPHSLRTRTHTSKCLTFWSVHDGCATRLLHTHTHTSKPPPSRQALTSSRTPPRSSTTSSACRWWATCTRRRARCSRAATRTLQSVDRL
jgi:class 3 adenylate cyclase